MDSDLALLPSNQDPGSSQPSGPWLLISGTGGTLLASLELCGSWEGRSKGKEKVWWEDVWRGGRVVLSPQGTVLQGTLGQLCPDKRVCVGLRPTCDNSLAAMAELLREAGSALPAYWLRQQ